jgi:hypothetical protein
MIPELLVTETVGFATDPKAFFNDLESVGGWPSREEIDKVTEVDVWADENRVYGIDVKYLLIDGNLANVTHGTHCGKHFQVGPLSESEFFVGMNGTVEQLLKQTEQTGQKGSAASSGKLRRLGFLVYDKSTGFITSHGPFPEKINTGTGLFRGFAALGLLKGFTGTLSKPDSQQICLNQCLDTLAVYKVIAGEAGWFGISDTSN